MKLGHTTIIYLFLLSIYNTINIIVKQKPVTEFITYSGVFLLFALALAILGNRIKTERIHGVIFLISGVMAEVMGDVGMAILMFIFSTYFFRDLRRSWIKITVVISISLFVRCYINQYSVPMIFNHAALHGYFGVVYYITLHPKPEKIQYIEGMTPEEAEIIQYIIRGDSPKEMQSKLSIELSVQAIYKRITRMRERHGYRNNEQMIYDLAKNGRLRPYV